MRKLMLLIALVVCGLTASTFTDSQAGHCGWGAGYGGYSRGYGAS